ncbi:MAG: glycosyltransferase, partial [Candidatus Lokiarchaeota archaeon]|nr:glycosyltransferase [Candidatus Lokiarchaeota archaeon]
MKVLFVLADNGGDFRRKSPFIYSQGESLKKIGVEVDYFILKGKSFIKYIFGINQLKKHLKSNDYDILHAHYSYTGWTVYFASKKPLVVSLMGSDVFSRDNKIKKVINIFIIKRVLALANAIICKSNNIKEAISRHKEIFVIPNGVDLDVFYPMDKMEVRKKLNLDQEKKYILFVGNKKRKEKNYKLAKKVYEKINRDEIELLAVNGVSQDQLNLYYNAANVLLMTSLYEGSPNVIKESMACNLPIVSTDVGDVKER